jgi:hypothetical protein
MSKASQIINEVGLQFRTKSREGKNNGSKHIRHQMENALRDVRKMMEQGNGLPSPANDESMRLLKSVESALMKSIDAAKQVKDTRRK